MSGAIVRIEVTVTQDTPGGWFARVVRRNFQGEHDTLTWDLRGEGSIDDGLRAAVDAAVIRAGCGVSQ